MTVTAEALGAGDLAPIVLDWLLLLEVLLAASLAMQQRTVDATGAFFVSFVAASFAQVAAELAALFGARRSLEHIYGRDHIFLFAALLGAERVLQQRLLALEHGARVAAAKLLGVSAGGGHDFAGAVALLGAADVLLRAFLADLNRLIASQIAEELLGLVEARRAGPAVLHIAAARVIIVVLLRRPVITVLLLRIVSLMLLFCGRHATSIRY